jgi:transposase-like protein
MKNNKHKRGRPLKLTVDRQKQICSYVSQGYPPSYVYRFVGVHRSTIWLWRKKYPEFEESLRKAYRKFLYET